MATHSSVLAWRIPGTGEPGGLPSMGSHRVGHDWSDLAAAAKLSWSLESSEHSPFDKLVKLKLPNSLLGFCLLFQCLLPPHPSQISDDLSSAALRSSLASLSARWPWLLCPACSGESGNLQVGGCCSVPTPDDHRPFQYLLPPCPLYSWPFCPSPGLFYTTGSSTIALDTGANPGIKLAVEEFSC